jgi:hypothetical protein
MREWILGVVVIAAVVALFGITPGVLGFPPPDLPTLLGIISFMLLTCTAIGLTFTLAIEYSKRGLRNKIFAETGVIAVLSFLATKYWAMPSLAVLPTDPSVLFSYDFSTVYFTVLFMGMALYNIMVDVIDYYTSIIRGQEGASTMTWQAPKDVMGRVKNVMRCISVQASILGAGATAVLYGLNVFFETYMIYSGIDVVGAAIVVASIFMTLTMWEWPPCRS